MNATKMVHTSNAILERDWECEMEMEMEMEKWMGLFELLILYLTKIKQFLMWN